MTPRRSRYAPSDESRMPHWLVTYDAWRTVLAHEYLVIGADLQAVMRKAIAECKADGWAVENDGAYGFFFCTRPGERREIRIQPNDPAEPIPLNNTPPAAVHAVVTGVEYCIEHELTLELEHTDRTLDCGGLICSDLFSSCVLESFSPNR
jgi:hypothetical protein